MSAPSSAQGSVLALLLLAVKLKAGHGYVT